MSNIFNILLFVQFMDSYMRLLVPTTIYMKTPVRFCGQRLPVELSILCKGKYNEGRG